MYITDYLFPCAKVCPRYIRCLLNFSFTLPSFSRPRGRGLSFFMGVIVGVGMIIHTPTHILLLLRTNTHTMNHKSTLHTKKHTHTVPLTHVAHYQSIEDESNVLKHGTHTRMYTHTQGMGATTSQRKMHV